MPKKKPEVYYPSTILNEILRRGLDCYNLAGVGWTLPCSEAKTPAGHRLPLKHWCLACLVKGSLLPCECYFIPGITVCSKCGRRPSLL
jgi:hypothetical protein